VDSVETRTLTRDAIAGATMSKSRPMNSPHNASIC
jgi:hypothetical protein